MAALAATILALAMGMAAPAHADSRTLTFRYGPISLGAYEVHQENASFDIPKPDYDGSITAMNARLVDTRGREMPRQRLMLHHVVFLNMGARLGERHDATCDRYTLFDGRTVLPGVAERFYGLGEERAKLRLPPGYGYPVKGADRWVMSWMLMNHLPRRDTAFVEYDVTYDTSPDVKPVKPVWLDVGGCSADPVFDVPGGAPRGSTSSRTMEWRAPYSGRLIAGRGHVHGGAKDLVLSEPDCGDREIIRSRPTWGRPNHAVYKLRPVLHEPGPLHMSGAFSEQGWPIAAGQRLRLTSHYDAELPHTRVMGIVLAYIAADPSVRDGCGPVPTDVQTVEPDAPKGGSSPPRIQLPLTAYGGDGKTKTISRPSGATISRASGGSIDVGNYAFGPANVVVPRGATLTWRFPGATLHNVTLASGPRAFSSPNLNDGRSFKYRFKRPGTYRLFCALHPVGMNATVTVGAPK